MTEEETDQIIEGIIIEADFGFNIKYTDLEHLYLKLIIQQFDGFLSTQLFKVDKVGKLLQQFRGDFHGELSVKTLSFYGTHQQENKSKILYTGGNEYLEHSKNEKIKAKYIFHVCFQLSSLIDYVS